VPIIAQIMLVSVIQLSRISLDFSIEALIVNNALNYISNIHYLSLNISNLC